MLIECGPVHELSGELRDMLRGVRDPEIELAHTLFDERHVSLLADQLLPSMSAFSPAITILLCESAPRSELVEPLLQHSRGNSRMAASIVVSPVKSADAMAQWFRMGASDVWLPPLRKVEVLGRFAQWLDQLAEERQTVQRLKEKLGLQMFIGDSPALLAVLERIPTIAGCDVSVLINGETGTGKEICARAIHFLSRRSGKPFIPVNCGALPTELIENELFGHESGAYTSANAGSVGLIQEADGGVLFLDEVDALPVAAQAKLLRFLQEKEYRPLGSRKSRRADVRVVTATNTTLEDAMQAGRFRRDLYYRLNVVPLTLPPLRERAGDIRLLAVHFLRKYALECGKPVDSFAPAALQKLVTYGWPGNVRELENIVARAVVLSRRRQLDVSEIFLGAAETKQSRQTFKTLKAQMLADFERSFLTEALRAHEGNISKAAQASGKDRRAFWELMRKHGMTGEQSRCITA